MAIRARSKFVVPLAVAAVLVLHVGLALWAAAGESVTADEILHVTGGYFYNRDGDFRLHPENGVLPQRWAALPAWLGGAPSPSVENNDYWRTSDASVMGHQFFYETGHDHWPMLMAARMMMVIFSAGTGLLVFCWARALFGTAAGLIALIFFALCPNILAHAALATSDMAAVFFLLAAVGAFWRHLRAPTLVSGSLSAVVFGLACVAKYSAVLLLPMFALLLVWRVRSESSFVERRRWLVGAPLTILGHGAVTVLIIWAFYGFRYTAFAPDLPPADHFIVPWERVLPAIGLQGRVVEFCRTWKLLPEAFLYGYAWVIESVQARAAFLAGDYSTTGWVSFFPLAFLWKTPLALLLAIAAGLGVVWRRWAGNRERIRRDTLAVAPLLVLFAVYWAFSLTSKLNIGHRHILPTYPVLFILVGGLAAPGVLTGVWRLLLPILVLGQVAADVRVAPHYLAYFNEIAGGPKEGYRRLVDSSLDWGQDLPGLKTWLAEHARGEPAFLSYFGTGEPAYYGLKVHRLPFFNNFKIPVYYTPLTAGVYCVSATMLQQVYSPVRGPWTVELEKEYQQLRTLEPAFADYTRDPKIRAELERSPGGERWPQVIKRYDILRFARLCFYLRARVPDAMIGYSILIYRLNENEVARATNGPLSAWVGLIDDVAHTPAGIGSRQTRAEEVVSPP